MNLLEIAQLASNAFNALGKPSKFDHDDIATIKSGLEQLFKYCQHQQNEQEKAVQQATDQAQAIKEPSSSKGSK